MLNYQRVGDGGDGSVFFGSARVDKVPLKYEKNEAKLGESWCLSCIYGRSIEVVFSGDCLKSTNELGGNTDQSLAEGLVATGGLYPWWEAMKSDPKGLTTHWHQVFL